MREQQRTTDREKLRHMLGPAFAAYDRLLTYGCNEELGVSLLELGEGSRQLARQTNPPGTHYLHRRDSYEVMLGGLSLRQARARLRNIDTALTKLRSLVQPFDTAFGHIRQSNFSYLLDQLQEHKKKIEERLTKIGPKSHPDVTDTIMVIIVHVHENTGQFHDAEVSEVLEAAIGRPRPAGYPRFPTAESLRMWRWKRGFADLT